MMKKSKHLWGLFAGPAILVASASAFAADPVEQTTSANVNVTADFSKVVGPTYRAERYNNLSDANIYAAQRPEDVQFYNAEGLHGKIYRTWMSLKGYNEKDQTFDEGNLAPYLDDVGRLSDNILINVMPQELIQKGYTPEQLESVLYIVLKTLKQHHPKIKYVEAFNEPNWGLKKTLKPEDLYKYYVPFYEAVKKVNDELKPEVPLSLGGPAFSEYNNAWMTAFLDGYKADPSPDKRLEFISWHGYGRFEDGPPSAMGFPPYHMYKSDPSEVATERQRLDAELTRRNLDPNIPSFIDEIGIYPGPSFDDQKNAHADAIRQAAGTASLIYWYEANPKNVPFNWVFRHQTEERKDQLVSRVPKGQPIPTGKFTPYGNVLLMEHKLKATRVQATSDNLVAGKGVYSVASIDATGIAIMVWNYQSQGTQTAAGHITLNHIPKALQSKLLIEHIYRIDSKTSNYWADPAHGNLQEVSTKKMRVGSSRTEDLALDPNALELRVIEPAVSR